MLYDNKVYGRVLYHLNQSHQNYIWVFIFKVVNPLKQTTWSSLLNKKTINAVVNNFLAKNVKCRSFPQIITYESIMQYHYRNIY